MPSNDETSKENKKLSGKQALEKEREERRAATLRANLQRRKGQSRSREDEASPEDAQKNT